MYVPFKCNVSKFDIMILYVYVCFFYNMIRKDTFFAIVLSKLYVFASIKRNLGVIVMIKKLLGVAALAISLAGCSSAPIKVYGGDIPAGLTEQQVKGAIGKSLIARKWSVNEGDKVIYGSINVRAHSAKIKVPYSASRYELVYSDSTNLKGDLEKGTVHKRYNTWIKNLQSDINTNLNLQLGKGNSINSVQPFEYVLKKADAEQAVSSQEQAEAK